MTIGGKIAAVIAAPVVLIGAASLLDRYANAASSDAWAEFRAAVETACLDAAEPQFAEAAAAVDPFGSESYGLALVTGPARGAEESQIAAICVYDKQSGAVEIGGELPGWPLRGEMKAAMR